MDQPQMNMAMIFLYQSVYVFDLVLFISDDFNIDDCMV